MKTVQHNPQQKPRRALLRDPPSLTIQETLTATLPPPGAVTAGTDSSDLMGPHLTPTHSHGVSPGFLVIS